MSWMKTKTDESQTDARVAPESNYNRDMNSPPIRSKEIQPSNSRSSPNVSPSGGAKIGQSIKIEGTLRGNEDLVIDGQVKGRVDLNGHILTIGQNGKIEAGLSAKSVIVYGDVKGNINASDKIQIAASGTVMGDLNAPRIALDDGAMFAGRVDMGAETPKAKTNEGSHGERTNEPR